MEGNICAIFEDRLVDLIARGAVLWSKGPTQTVPRGQRLERESSPTCSLNEEEEGVMS